MRLSAGFLALLCVVTIIAAGCRARSERTSQAPGTSEASNTSATAPLSSARVVVLADTLLAADTLRLGRLHEGEQVRLPLALENRSSRPVAIAAVKSGCGCLDLEVAPEPIRPGDRAAAVLKFDARGLWGWQLKVLELRFAGAQPVRRIFVEAQVE